MRNLNGAVIEFSRGGEVSSFGLASDYSEVQILDLPLSATPPKVRQFLESFGFDVPLSAIRLRGATSSTVSEVKIKDPLFSEKAVQKLHSGTFEGQPIKVRAIQAGSASGVSLNRLQASTVKCSWFKASRVAWAQHDSEYYAERSAKTLNGTTVQGRTIQCKYQGGPQRRHGPETIYSVSVAGLPTTVSETALQSMFKSASKVVLGPSSWTLSEERAADYVKCLLSKAGALQSFECNTTLAGARVKATARFGSSREARKVIRELHAHKLGPMANAPLHLSVVVSVKFSVLADIYSAVLPELENIKPRIYSAGRINLKAYAPSLPNQRFATVRLVGEDSTSVAKAKSLVERVLNGFVAMNDGIIIWDDFFAKPDGLNYMKALRERHNLFAFCDSGKRQILLYGHEDSRKKVEEQLWEKVQTCSRQTHLIELDIDNFRVAIRSGFREITSRLGKDAATLDVVQRTISVRGTDSDRKVAESVLRKAGENLSNGQARAEDGEDICPVCFCEVADCFKAECGHKYCRSCFKDLLSSYADSGKFPLSCVGSGNTCHKSFALDELRSACEDGFESLLLASSRAYVQRRLQELRYCSTPDCDQIYRSTTDASVFDCPSCLSSICTGCHKTSHDGMSCAEYGAVSAEENEDFQKWKLDNNAKPCPQCGVMIQKSYGCNHMECTMCGTHICWFCMMKFTSGGLCCKHMGDTHENIL